MLRKYNDGNWEERRHNLPATVKVKHCNPRRPEATEIKRSELYFAGNPEEPVLSRTEFVSRNGEVRAIIHYLLGDDGVIYTL